MDVTRHCFICGRTTGPFDRHHLFGGALRGKSERLGLVVTLCRNCHTGPAGVHNNAKLMGELHEHGQREAMRRFGWTAEKFRREFYKNYIDEV